MLESIEEETATLYVDTSWVDLEDIKLLVERLKNTKRGDFTHRIMWASDAPVGDFNQRPDSYACNLKEFKNIFTDKNLINNLLYKNTLQLYDIQS